MTTLYLSEQGATLAKRDERLVVRKNGRSLSELPLLQLRQIVIFGNAVLTTPLVPVLLRRGIPVCYLSQSGRYRGRLQPAWDKNAALRRAQYLRAANPTFCLAVSRVIVAGKSLNMRAFVRRQRHGRGAAQQASAMLTRLARQAGAAKSLDELRGYEGAATAAYYHAWGRFIKPEVARKLPFPGRTRHPPRDPVNALLSLGYTLLYQEVLTALSLVGLDPYCGFLHQLKQGHAALASDLAEEWRATLVDSIVLTALNRCEITPGDFRQGRAGIRLTHEGLQSFLRRYEARLTTRTQHPRLNLSAEGGGGQVSYRRCLELQARELADLLLGRTESYRPFLIR